MKTIRTLLFIGLVLLSFSTKTFAQEEAPKGCWPRFTGCLKKTGQVAIRVTLTTLPIIIDILNGDVKFDTSSVQAINNSLTALAEKNPLAILELEHLMQDTTGLSKEKQAEAFKKLQLLGLIAADGKVTSKEVAQLLQTLLIAQEQAKATPPTDRALHQSFKQILAENRAAREA